MSIPTWLGRTLGDTFRTVRLRICPQCRAPVLAGLDADNCALAVRADPTPIGEIGEAIALLTGRRTFDLIGTGGDKKLYLREEHNIKSARKYLVFLEHRCGRPLTAYSEPAAARSSRKFSQTPPF